MAFSISSFKFELLANTSIVLPEYSGSTFRGGFGTAFKRTVCIYRPADCPECPYREKCAYSYIFETPVKNVSNSLHHHGYAPHPFVIEPALDEPSQINPGELFHITLNLIGSGLDYLPFFVFTFVRLGRMGIGKGRGKFSVKTVYSINGKEKEIYSGKTEKLNRSYYSFNYQGPENIPAVGKDEKEITVELLTPVRMQQQGKNLHQLPFSVLITGLLRRIRLLDAIHGDKQMKYEHTAWIEAAKSVRVVNSNLFWNERSSTSPSSGSSFIVPRFIIIEMKP